MKIIIALIIIAGSVWAQVRPGLTGVSHLSIKVSNVDSARGFYRDFLGLQEVRQPDGRYLYKVNSNQFIEVLPGLNPADDRLDHIAIGTADVAKLKAYLKGKGISILKDKFPGGGFGVLDPDDHRVEFVALKQPAIAIQGKPVSARIMHLGIIVGDADKAMRFYSDVLGFSEFWRGAAASSQTVSWINVRLPDSQDYLEYMLYSALPAPTQRGSQHHACLEVEDIEAVKARLEALPYFKTYGKKLEIRTGINRRRQLNLFDPDGTRIELMEPRTVDGVPPKSSTLPLPVGK